MKNSSISVPTYVSALAAAVVLLASVSAIAANSCAVMSDPAVTAACQPVWSACQAANVTDQKTGKTGYQYGEAGQGDGLWKNCVGPLAKGATPTGLTTVPSQQAAKSCQAAARSYFQANSATCRH